MSLTDSNSHPPPTSGTYAYNSFRPEVTGFPAQGGTYTEPIFDEIVTRITDVYTGDWRITQYGGHVLINADTDRILVAGNGIWEIYDTSGNLIKSNAQLSNLSVGNENIQYHPTNSDKILTLSGQYTKEFTVSTNSSANIIDWGGTVNNGGESNFTDRTGRYYCAYRTSGSIRFYDRTEAAFYSNPPSTSVSGGGLYMVPDGSGVVTSGDSTGDGVNFYPVNHSTNSFGTRVNVSNGAPHCTVITDDNGTSWLIASADRSGFKIGGTSMTSSTAYFRGDMVKVQLDDPTDAITGSQVKSSHNLTEFSAYFSSDSHFSGNIYASGLRNYVLIETFDSNENPSSWVKFQEELLLIDVTDKSLVRLAHHRTRSPAYEEQPKASVSMDGSLVVWTSNFNRTSGYYADVYSVTTGLGGESSSSSLSSSSSCSSSRSSSVSSSSSSSESSSSSSSESSSSSSVSSSSSESSESSSVSSIAITVYTDLWQVTFASSSSSESSSSSSESSSSFSSESSSESSSSSSESSSSFSSQSSSSSSESSSSSSSISSSSSESSSESSSSSSAAGTVCWGHDTNVEEQTAGDFNVNWSGGTVNNPGVADTESLTILTGQASQSEIWSLGAGAAKIVYDKYQSGTGPAPTIYYKTGGTSAACNAANWHIYSGASTNFTSLGHVRLKFSR